jgi:hypothetical protein
MNVADSLQMFLAGFLGYVIGFGTAWLLNVIRRNRGE